MKCRLPKQLSEYRDVSVFAVTLLAAHYAWKLTFSGDEGGTSVSWLGADVTAVFEFVTCHIVSAVYWLVALFSDTAYMSDAHTIRFASGSASTIVWSCSGLKQGFIWLCLMITVPPMTQVKTAIAKLWYIPIGWVCCYGFNILRIFLIAMMIENHPEWFHILHDYVFKYLFYGMLFGLWLIFVEKIRPTVLSR